MKRKTTEEWIKDARKIHGNKYDYSKSIYTKNNSYIIIICKKHGEFEQWPAAHSSNGSGCPRCKAEIASERNRMSSDNILKRLQEKYNGRYSYPNFIKEYVNFHSSITIKCNLHNLTYSLQLCSHLQKHSPGCKKCIGKSYGESIIEYILNERDVSYISQYKFPDCKIKRSLPFDFYLPDLNVCIEFDGKQHFDESSIYSSENIKLADIVKNKFCLDNNIRLIRVSYKDQQNINSVLEAELFS